MGHLPSPGGRRSGVHRGQGATRMGTRTTQRRAGTIRARRPVLAAGLIAVALVGAACSSQSGTTSATPEPGTSASSSTGSGANGSGGSTPGAPGTGRPPVSRPATPTGPVPTVTGPVTGGAGKANAPAPAKLLADAGYVEEEYFFAGDATAFTLSGRGPRMASGTPSPPAPPLRVTRARAPADVARGVQRHGVGGVDERHRRCGRGGGLRLHEPGAARPGIHLRGRDQAGGGAPGGEGVRSGALRVVGAPGRPVLLRPVHPGRPGRAGQPVLRVRATRCSASSPTGSRSPPGA
jgi:hypothetical protein